mmetsp:Transcript_85743/g.223005  ORF Transcript_85743/g.223005 Transcript_85743/m.223005 type:complete len:214 (+) Transcript_85743:1540-2181(+)
MLPGIVLDRLATLQVLHVRCVHRNDPAPVREGVVHARAGRAQEALELRGRGDEARLWAEPHDEALAPGLELEHLHPRLERTGQRVHVKRREAGSVALKTRQDIVDEVRHAHRERRVFEDRHSHRALQQTLESVGHRTRDRADSAAVVPEAVRWAEAVLPILLLGERLAPALGLRHGAHEALLLDPGDQCDAAPGHLHPIHVNLELLRVKIEDR